MTEKRWLVLVLGVVLMTSSSTGASAGDGIVALQTAAPSCPDNTSNIYVDCKNGTVTDNRTGLVWLANANCLNGSFDWYTAMEFVAGLSDLPGDDPNDCGLKDGSSPGEWRLPSEAEWQAMIANAVGAAGDPDCTFSPPTITNDSGLGCWVSGPSSFSGVVSSSYWGSTTLVSFPTTAWFVNLNIGFGGGAAKTLPRYVWPVRGGQ